MSKIELKAASRELVGKKTKKLRAQAVVPAAVYGPNRESTNLSLQAKEFTKVLKTAGYTALINLVVNDDKPVKVLVKEVQQHPVTGEYVHVSLYQVDEKTPLTADVPVILIGESPAVKLNLGFLTSPVNSVTVRCLPDDLPQSLELDIGSLAEVGDSLTISDLVLPEKVELHSSMQSTTSLATIQAPQKKLEIEEEEVEGEEEEGEETEGEEGEAPAEEVAE